MIEEHQFLITGVVLIIIPFILINVNSLGKYVFFQGIAILFGILGFSFIGYALVKLFFMEPYQNEKDK